MKKIIFHIGTNKTGTTTLQDSFAKSRARLESSGILYPDLSRYTHHTQLIFSVLEDEEYTGAFGRNTPEGVQASKEISERLWSKLEEQVAQSACHTLVLSTEYAFGMRPQAWERMSARLAAFGDELHLVGYFRSPASHFNSSQQQVLKYGHTIESPCKPIPYKGKIQKLKARAGAQSIRVNLFDRKSLKGGDIIEDFVGQIEDICGTKLPEIDHMNDNESVSAEAVRLLYAFNKRAFPNSRRPGNPTSKVLLGCIKEAEARIKGLQRPKLRARIKQTIDAVNMDEAIWLRDEMRIVFPDFDFNADAKAPDAFETDVGKRHLRPEDVFEGLNGDTLLHLQAEVLKTLFDKVFEIRGQAGKRIPQARKEGVTPTISHLTEMYFPNRRKAGVIWENYRRMFQKTLMRYGAALPDMADLSAESIADILSFVMFEMIKVIRKSNAA